MNSEYRNRVVVHLDDEHAEKVKEKAKRLGLSLSSAIRMVLLKWVENDEASEKPGNNK